MHPTRSATVREFASKLRITAALLGCASQKDLCAQFHKVNPGTTFDLERSYKWMQGRSLPRSARVYEDWAALLGTDAPLVQLQSCTVGEFLDLLCAQQQVSRQSLAARAGVAIGAPADEASPDRRRAAGIEPPPHRQLAGAYACYSHAWSPYFQGKIIRGSLVIVATAKGGPTFRATYSETISLGAVQLSGPVKMVNRSIYLELIDAGEEFRLSMCLFVPGPLANVLAGIMSGATFLDSDPQPAATRIVMVRIPGAAAGALEPTNRYLNPAQEPLSRDLSALGVSAATPAELDALLQGFLRGDQATHYIKVAADEYSRLTLAIDRLFIENDLVAGVRPPPVRQSSRDAVRLVRG